MSNDGIDNHIKTLYKYFQAFVPIILFFSLSILVVVDFLEPDRMYFYWELVSVLAFLALLPFIPYISKIRFHDTEVDMSHSEWVEDKRKLSRGAIATPEGDNIHEGREQHD